MEINQWSKTAGNNTFTVPDGAPEDWKGKNVNDTLREVMAVLRRNYESSAYIEITHQLPVVGAKSLTRISGSQIRVLACDATSFFLAGRRIKMVGATTAYGQVTSSAVNGADTDVFISELTVPTSPTAIYVHVDPTLRTGAFFDVGAGEGLDADTVDGLHAESLIALGSRRNAIVNGGFMVWQGYAGAVTLATGVRTFVADNITLTASAAATATAERTSALDAAARSKYGLLVTGGAGVTTCFLSTRIESLYMRSLKRTVTFSLLVTNNTGANVTLSLGLLTADAEDDFTTTTQRLTTSLSPVIDGATERVTHTVDISGFTDIENGLLVRISVPSGRLDSAAKSIKFAEMQLEVGDAFTVFDQREQSAEELACFRYYWISGDLAEDHTDGLMCVFHGRQIASVELAHGSCMFPVPMRAVPTALVYFTGVAGAAYDLSAVSSGTGYTVDIVTNKGVRSITNASNIPNGNLIAFNIEADARL